MSADANGRRPGPGRPRRRGVWLVAIIVVVLGAAALAVGPPGPGEAYDPRGTGPLGLAGMVELLDTVGADVEVSSDLPSDISTYLFIPVDRLRDDDRTAVTEWVADGGTVVVAGTSPLHDLPAAEGPVQDLFGATPRAPGCDAPALEEVTSVEHAGWDGLQPPDDAEQVCFPLGQEAAFLVALAHGDGTVVALGSPAPFVNANLASADNAALAAALLSPAAGDGLVVMPPPEVGEGDTAVLDLVPDGFWRLLVLGSIAVVLLILWAARRLGRPVEERLPPVLPSAELARSIAGLLQRSGDRATAAERLRADACRRVERTWGLPAGTDRGELVSLVVERLGLARPTAQRALLGAAVPDDDTLFEVALACSQLQRALRTPAGEVPDREADEADEAHGAAASATHSDDGNEAT